MSSSVTTGSQSATVGIPRRLRYKIAIRTPHVEYATLEWVDWFNNRRLLESIGHVPPAEYEREYHRLNEAQAMAA
jgi:transposase InsO family protein